MIKCCVRLLFLCSLLLGLHACETESEDFYICDELMEGVWVGDLGFSDLYGEPLESGLTFKPNGLGRDEQVYYDDPYGEVVFSLPLRWDVYGGALRLDYGIDYPLLEIYDVYVSRKAACPACCT